MNWTLYKVLILFCIILIETGGQYYLKKGSQSTNTFHLVVGMILRIDSRMQIPTPGICVESERPLVRRFPERC